MPIQLRHIYKSFGDHNVFTNLNAIFNYNSATAIMGHSGCGKTTLANLLARFIYPDYGEIRGLDSLRVSMVFQEDRLLEQCNALENLLFVTRYPSRNIAHAKHLLEEAGLRYEANEKRKKAREFSGGMKRRLSLCRALMIDFDLLILDEPFKGLDAKLKPQIMDMVRRYSKGKTLILITHDEEESRFFKAEIFIPANIAR